MLCGDPVFLSVNDLQAFLYISDSDSAELLVCAGFFSSVQHTMDVFQVTANSVILHTDQQIILLRPAVFIFGLHMDVAGAAIATVIAQFASCAFAFCFLIGKKVPIRITRLRKPAWSPMIVKRILVLGVSPFLILATDSVIIIVLNAMLQKYGGPAGVLHEMYILALFLMALAFWRHRQNIVRLIRGNENKIYLGKH